MIRKFDFENRDTWAIRNSLPLHTTDMVFGHRDLMGLGFMTGALRDALRKWLESEHFLITDRPIFYSNPKIGQISLAESFANFAVQNRDLGAELDQYIEWLERVGGIEDDVSGPVRMNIYEQNFDAWRAALCLFAARSQELTKYGGASEDLRQLVKVVQEQVNAPDQKLQALEKALQPDWNQFEDITDPALPRSDWDNLVYKEVVLDFEINLDTVLVIAPKYYHFSRFIDWYDDNLTGQQKQDIYSEVVHLAQQAQTLGCNWFSMPLEQLRYRPSGETYL